ncbi:hypothetical protein EC919_10734 [Pseudomonas graminis]|nr:hypothetical protein EC919_10734 [Pseudomonas graminis]
MSLPQAETRDDAERHGMHAHAERGYDQRWAAKFPLPIPASSRLKPVPLKSDACSQWDRL